MKNCDIFLIFALNIDCGYTLEPPQRGCSNEYPQSMFKSKNKKNNIYPCIPQFYYIKVGFTRVTFTRTCYPDVAQFSSVTRTIMQMVSVNTRTLNILGKFITFNFYKGIPLQEVPFTITYKLKPDDRYCMNQFST